jgi:peptide deformylase|tara:strand:- start:23 stop:469 length:447 start_codon:yes stop_codon:yes gene_type:complete
MAVLDILAFPNPRLRNKSVDVEEHENMRGVVNNMVETMYTHQGVGLAAPQIGIRKNLIIFDPSDDMSKLTAMVNPIIKAKDGEVYTNEECLSVPNMKARIKRSKNIKVKYRDLDGDTITKDFSGFESICIQHEMDHLKGKLIIDYIAS